MPLDWIDDELARLASAHLLRQRVCRSGKIDSTLVIDGQRYVSFASNDYLGIAQSAEVAEAVQNSVARNGWGSASSALIVGRSAMHAELERRLATFVEKEAALLFPTGFAANVGTIPALVGRGDLILSDAKNHASIIDGCRLSRAEIVIFPHRDTSAVRASLAAAPNTARKLIVTDSVFSMDGDVAPLGELAAISAEFNAILMVDEAHGLGVIGPRGRGVAAEQNVAESVDVLVGTLSKSFGSHGGFVAGSRQLVDYLANRARSYVFSTAAPVAASAAALAALGIIRDQPERREQLLAMSEHLRNRLTAQGWALGGGHTHIIPIILGSEPAALELTEFLRDRGFWVPCIRPPTVPPGESCLRISLASTHSQAMVDGLLEALDEFRNQARAAEDPKDSDVAH